MRWDGTAKDTKEEILMTRDFNLPRSELEHLIDEWILSERNRAIMKRRWLDGICYEPLAEEFDLSVRQVKNIVYKCEERLFKRIQV